MEFKDMFDALQKHIREGQKSEGKTNTLFVKFLVHIQKILNPRFDTYLDAFKNAQEALDSGKISDVDRAAYSQLIEGAASNISKTYEIINNAWRAYEVRIGADIDEEDIKFINAIIDQAKIHKQNAIKAIDEIKKINKKYDL